MGKRYVFWRTPTGKPYKGDDGKHAPTVLLEKIGRSASTTAEGSISWLFHDIYWNELALQSAAVVIDPSGNELNETDAWSIVWKAMKSTIKRKGIGKPILPKDLIVSADELAASHFRESVVDYVLVTSLSIESLPAKCIRIGDCEVTALSKRGSKYPFPNAVEMQRGVDLFSKHLKPTKYNTIKVKTSGRSVYEATNRALDALNLLRGLWTLFATYGSRTIRMGTTRQEPIGVIHTGPIHTLHKPDGSLATEIFWFAPDYMGDRNVFKPKGGWEKIEKDRHWAMRRMKRHGYRQDIEQLVVRYAEALDHSNLDVAFLQMWSILEKITDTVGANYDETIARATWSYKDRGIAKELLKHLRFRRNQYVHAAKSGEQRDQVAYLVKSFVDPHLLQLIRNDLEVASLKEHGEFLGLSTDVKTLEKRRNQFQRAIRIRLGYGPSE